MRDCARHPAAPLLLAALLSAAAVAAHALDCTASPQLCAELSLTSYTAEGEMNGFIVMLISGAPPFMFLVMQASGWPTVQRIRVEGTTGALSPLPFVSLLVNCTVWSLYGLLKADSTVLAPNGAGVVAGAYYTSVFVRHAARPVGSVLAGAAALMAAAALTAAVLPTPAALSALGWGGSALAVCLMASPLATMQTVLRERSTRAMPFATSAATFLNACSWLAYGALVARDPFVTVPNALGVGASCLQLALFARYGIHHGGADKGSLREAPDKGVDEELRRA